MKVTAGEGKAFDIDPADLGTVTGFKELLAIEKAFGMDVQQLKPMQQAGALIWTLVKRQDPTVRIDDIDFDLADFPTEAESEPPDPSVSPTSDTGT